MYIDRLPLLVRDESGEYRFSAFRLYISLIEEIPPGGMQVAEPCGIGRLTQSRRYLCHQFQIVDEIGFPYQGLIILLILQS